VEAKKHLYAQLARLTKALASPGRIELLDLLSQGPQTVETLARATGMTPANASQHLQVLRGARLVEAEKRGLFVRYRLAASPVAAFLVQLRRLGESQLSELQLAKADLLASAGDVESIDRATLLRRLKAGDAVLVDVRPREEYEEAHLPRAVSIPLTELRQRLKDLPKNSEIVAYCRGPYCMLSVDAARILAKSGRMVSRLEDGVSEWRDAGLRVVERSPARSARSSHVGG
jgi:rhodanese-related sulfurtransferase